MQLTEVIQIRGFEIIWSFTVCPTAIIKDLENQFLMF